MKQLLLLLGVLLVGGQAERLMAQADDVRARDADRERIQKMIEAIQKKSGQAPQTPPPAETATPPPPASGETSEAALAKTVAAFTTPLPRNLTTLVVDGRRLRVKNPSELARPEFERPALFMPRGTHLVKFHEDGVLAPSEKAAAPLQVVKDAFFSAQYAAVRQRFLDGGAVSIAKLAPNLWEAKENFQSPLTPHLLGNYYFSQKKFKVAERKYWQAIRINPCFVLAHLNLACIYAKHSEELIPRSRTNFNARAAEELHWAEEFNVGDAFGVSEAIAALREELKIAPLMDDPEFRLENYQSVQEMDATDRRAVGFLAAAMKYMPNDIERAKLVNNKAVYFKLKRKNDLALEAYVEALRVLGDTVKDTASRQVVTQILTNAGTLCKTQWQGGDEEFDIYRERIEQQWRESQK